MITDQQILELVATRQSLQAISKALVYTANQCGGNDNITLVLGECSD